MVVIVVNCTPFLHSLLTKGKTRAQRLQGSREWGFDSHTRTQAGMASGRGGVQGLSRN